MKCCLTGCEREAVGAVGIEIYPLPALMRFYKTTRPLSRMIVGLEICSEHLPEVHDLFNVEQLEGFSRACEASSNVTVDRTAFKTVLIAFDDPDYLQLLKMRKEK